MEKALDRKEVMIYLNGRNNPSFRCTEQVLHAWKKEELAQCNCNVFTIVGKNQYRCNCCGAIYEGD